jgi:NitT/TauT family transport system substrate-binding protein
MSRQFLFITVFCFLVVVGFVGSNEAKSVKVSIPAHSISHIAFYVAKERGYFREEGLEVDLILMGAPVAIRALIGGDVEVSTVGGSAIPPIIRGAPLHFLFTSFIRPIHWLYSKPGISEVRELKGKKIAIDGLGGVLESLLREILTRHGLDSSRDVTVLAMGVQSTRYAALASGSIDTTVLTFPWNFTAADAGFRDLVNFTSQDIVQFTGSMVVRQALMQSDSALVEKFTRATYKGLLYARENRTGTIAVLARNLKIKEDMAGKIYDLSRPAMTLDGTVSEESQKRVVQDILKLMGQKESPPLERVFNFSLVRRIRAELEAGGWKP